MELTVILLQLPDILFFPKPFVQYRASGLGAGAGFG